MSIMELGALGEFVAAVAVLITLIYLTIQVRNTREESTRAVLQSRAELSVGSLMSSAASDGLSAAYARAAEAVGETHTGFVAELMQRGVGREDALRLQRAEMANWRRNATAFRLEGWGENDSMLRNVYSSELAGLFWDHFVRNIGSSSDTRMFVEHVNQLLAKADTEAQQ